MKIDAEGCDEDIVLGAAQYLNVARPVIMIEITGNSLLQLAGKLEHYAAYTFQGSHNGLLVPKEKGKELKIAGLISVDS